MYNPDTDRFSTRRTVSFDETWRQRHMAVGHLPTYADNPMLGDSATVSSESLLRPAAVLPPACAPEPLDPPPDRSATHAAYKQKPAAPPLPPRKKARLCIKGWNEDVSDLETFAPVVDPQHACFETWGRRGLAP